MRKHNILLSLVLILLACSNNQASKNLSLDEYTIDMLQTGYSDGSLKIIDVVNYYLEMIEKVDRSGPKLNSVIIVNPDAKKIAKELDKNLKSIKNMDPMYGIPVLLKDNIDTEDKMPTTAGSLILKDSYPLKDSWVAEKLRIILIPLSPMKNVM